LVVRFLTLLLQVIKGLAQQSRRAAGAVVDALADFVQDDLVMAG